MIFHSEYLFCIELYVIKIVKLLEQNGNIRYFTKNEMRKNKLESYLVTNLASKSSKWKKIDKH